MLPETSLCCVSLRYAGGLKKERDRKTNLECRRSVYPVVLRGPFCLKRFDHLDSLLITNVILELLVLWLIV